MSQVTTPPTSEQPDMITLRKACKRVGKSLTWCYDSAKSDSFIVPVFKLSSRWVVSRLALEEILTRQHAA